MVALLLMLCVLTGCGAKPAETVAPETTQDPKEVTTNVKEQEAEQEMVTIIMSALLSGEQTIEKYVAELDDPTAKVYDAEHYTVEVTEEQRLEVVEAFYEEGLSQLKEVAGAGAVITAGKDFRNIDVTGELAEQFSFVFTAALIADAAQAYNLVEPADRSCKVTLNGKEI
jgi:maltose-binding protein MalE